MMNLGEKEVCHQDRRSAWCGMHVDKGSADGDGEVRNEIEGMNLGQGAPTVTEGGIFSGADHPFGAAPNREGSNRSVMWERRI